MVAPRGAQGEPAAIGKPDDPTARGRGTCGGQSRPFRPCPSPSGRWALPRPTGYYEWHAILRRGARPQQRRIFIYRRTDGVKPSSPARTLRASGGTNFAPRRSRGAPGLWDGRDYHDPRANRRCVGQIHGSLCPMVITSLSTGQNWLDPGPIPSPARFTRPDCSPRMAGGPDVRIPYPWPSNTVRNNGPEAHQAASRAAMGPGEGLPAGKWRRPPRPSCF